MTDDPHAFIYLDPPYAIKDNLYGHRGDMHKGFDHDRFYRKCAACDCDQMVSYNSDKLIKERFKGWQVQEYDHTYTMRSVGEYNKEQEKRIRELLLGQREINVWHMMIGIPLSAYLNSINLDKKSVFQTERFWLGKELSPLHNQ